MVSSLALRLLVSYRLTSALPKALLPSYPTCPYETGSLVPSLGVLKEPYEKFSFIYLFFLYSVIPILSGLTDLGSWTFF